MTAAFSHIGICVSDLERSVRFYRDALGFGVIEEHAVGTEFGTLMEIEDVKLRSCFLRRDGVSIELLHFDEPGHTGEAVRRPMNRLGLTHLSVRVDDVDTAAQAVAGAGGTVHHGTRTTFGSGTGALDFVYCTDPDGVRVELMRLPA